MVNKVAQIIVHSESGKVVHTQTTPIEFSFVSRLEWPVDPRHDLLAISGTHKRLYSIEAAVEAIRNNGAVYFEGRWYQFEVRVGDIEPTPIDELRDLPVLRGLNVIKIASIERYSAIDSLSGAESSLSVNGRQDWRLICFGEFEPVGY